MLKRFLSCVGQYKKETILAPITIAFEVLIEICIPYIMAEIIDTGIMNGDIKFILMLGGIMVGMSLVAMLCGMGSGYFASISSTGFAGNLRRKVFVKVEEFSFLNTDKYITASLVTRLTTDVTNVQNAFMMIIRTLVRAPLMLIGATFMAFQLDSKLALIFLCAIPFLAGLLGFVALKAKPRFEKMLKNYDNLNVRVQEDLTAIRVVKSFVREDYEIDEFNKVSDKTRWLQVRAERLLMLASPAMQFVMYACMIAVAYFGGKKILAGDMTSGELMSFISYITQILMSLMMICFIFVMLVMSRASISRIDEILTEKIDITDEDADEKLSVKNGDICFENVSFSYNKDPNKSVLTDVNLNIKSGEIVGILGGTGSAKSSLVQLIPRLYDVTKGRLTVAGEPVGKYKLKILRDSVAMVLQKNVLFSGTIKENLRWGNQNATDEEIINACKAAQAHDFIMSFPKGYETDLGQGGVNVSGGQKQRLCIARALLKNPKILILDDSTSAVDTATDNKIRAVFNDDYKDTTILIIAQRINSVMDADKIIVMDNGKISAIGTHEELMKTSEIYQEVYHSQQKEVA